MAQTAAIASPPTTLQFIARFRALHDRLRAGTMSPAERLDYTAHRQQFIRLMLISQQVGVTGQTLVVVRDL